ncbi:MAG: hypothetical protein FWD35_02140 [Oscillospiraceae bacterium]|nr:hypothetical protein [Oscillospiraceae bacterium]
MLTKIRKSKSGLWAIVATVVIFALLGAFVFTMLGGAAQTSADEEVRVVREGILRAVVSCYAFEGFYPPDFAYLTEHYNIIIDHERYHVYYNKIADNLMPEVYVTLIGSAESEGEL